MKRKKILLILAGIMIFLLLIIFLTTLFVEPWVGDKIEAAVNDNNLNYMVKIDKVHIRVFKSGIELENIKLWSKQSQEERHLAGEIASIKLNAINLIKAIFKKEIDIGKVTIFNSRIQGKIPFSNETASSIVMPLTIRIGTLFFDKIDLAMENTLNTESYAVKEGVLKVYDLHLEKKDTLSLTIMNQFDFEAKEFVSCSSDSMYSFRADSIIYSATSHTLAVSRLSIQPNYADYNFTSRYEFQTDRIEAGFSNMYVHGFYAAGYFNSGSIISSYIEIGKMDIDVFRDMRKKFRHVNKPAFQSIIYNYPGTIRIDSIGVASGNVTYTEHAEKANEPGRIHFNEINAKLYNITNNPIYKTESASIEVKGDALVMGKGKLTILLKGRLFDSQNTFTLSGTLSDMEINELNPILEKNAFIYATSGKIERMSFNFTADNTQATGKMTLLYHGLNVTVKHKQTDDTTAFGQRFLSFMANKKVLDSNPIPGQEVRMGTIYHERDPERFLFNYCYKSILSGITSSLYKNPKKNR